MEARYTGEDWEYAETDRAEKTKALVASTDAMGRLSQLVEDSINAEPAKFTPRQARDMRAAYADLLHAVESINTMLSDDRDEFHELNNRLRHLSIQQKNLQEQLTKAVEQRTQYYNELLGLRQQKGIG